jgi:hypothetical protein
MDEPRMVSPQEVIEDLLARAVNPLRLRIFELESAVAELQTRAGLKSNPLELEGKN